MRADKYICREGQRQEEPRLMRRAVVYVRSAAEDPLINEAALNDPFTALFASLRPGLGGPQ